MKKSILFIFLFIPIGVFPQTEKPRELGGGYYFYKAPPASVTTQIRSDGDTDIHVPMKGRIYYLYSKDDRVYYSYYPFQDRILEEIYNSFKLIDSINKDNPFNAPEADAISLGRFFSMDTTEFRNITKPLYRRFKGFSAGAYTLPFRVRGIGSNFDFESALSLQANVIAGFGSIYSDHSWFDLSFGVGLTGVKLTPKNSNVEEERSANAFTLSFGGVFKTQKFINAGLFIGADFLGRSDREVNWEYNKELWLGLGINITFNEITTEKALNKASDVVNKGQ